jgi:hypothetical protein
MWKHFVEVGEQKLSQLTGAVLSNEALTTLVQELMKAALDARSQVARATKIAFAALNLPTLDDVHRLEEKLGEIEDLFKDMVKELERLEKAREG